MAGVATYSEIEEKWDICLVFDANEALTLKLKAEKEAADGAGKRH